MKRNFVYKKIENLHSMYKHPSYYLERKLISEIKRGLLENATQTMDTINALERAKLAPSPLRSEKNSLIGSCTLFVRAAIESHVDPELAFTLSDFFINEIEHLNDLEALRKYEYHMVKEIIALVTKSRVTTYSLPVTQMIEYIHGHISEDVSLSTLTDLIGKSKEYLSALFKEEVGSTVTDYIHEQKVEESKNFLVFTELTVTDIALLFHFCNTSYYSRIFKRYTGITPSRYRKERGLME